MYTTMLEHCDDVELFVYKIFQANLLVFTYHKYQIETPEEVFNTFHSTFHHR